MRVLPLLVAALLTAGCSSDSSQPIVSVSAPATAPTLSTSAAGTWRGALADGRKLNLYLTQSGPQVRGVGAIFQGEDPRPLQAGGTASDNALQLDMVSGTSYNARLNVQLQGQSGVGSMTIEGEPGNPTLTLTRSSTVAPLALPALFQVGSYQVALERLGDGEYLGTWSVAGGGEPLVCVRSFSTGVARYSPDLDGGWARLSRTAPSGGLELGTAWVQLAAGARVPSVIDPDSRVTTARGSVPF